MACVKSLLAKRIVLWYILVGSIVIFPLTLSVSLGCRFLTVISDDDDRTVGAFKYTVDTYDTQGLGAFNVAIYDQEIILGGAINNSNEFLGCVDYSTFWQNSTSNDMGFTASRIASGCLLAFTTLATLISTCLQCFVKRGKSHLWNVMRVCYIGALVSQVLMYTVFAAEMCRADNNQCMPGRNGLFGILNCVLLLGMVVATFLSLPPRNPVFQCWGSSEYDDESDGGSTEEEDEVMRKFKSFGETGGKSVSMVDNDSVSLFGGSRMSRKSRKSMKWRTAEDEMASAAENGLSTVDSSGPKSHNYRTAEGSTVASRSRSLSSSKSKKKTSSSVVVATVDSASVASAKSVRSGKSKSKMPSMVAKYLSTDKSADNDSVSSLRSKKSAELVPGDSQLDPIFSAPSGVLSTGSGETGNFISQLVEMTELGEGGRRVKKDEQDNLVEIIDEYPKEAGREIESTPSSDVVKIRTEYYDMGSRTTKEITHQDGSCTIVTTIAADDPTQRKAADAPIEMTNSTASIQSTNSSKYQVLETTSSVETPTIFKGAENEKQPVGQGALCLSP